MHSIPRFATFIASLAIIASIGDVWIISRSRGSESQLYGLVPHPHWKPVRPSASGRNSMIFHMDLQQWRKWGRGYSSVGTCIGYVDHGKKPIQEKMSVAAVCLHNYFVVVIFPKSWCGDCSIPRRTMESDIDRARPDLLKIWNALR